ncbi:MAG: benzoate-CoA ligase family protein [Vicinamibacterales bacterium]
MTTAADLGVPEVFNAAAWFVDRHVEEGRAAAVAIECGDERVTYGDLHERVNRVASALIARGIRPGDRVVLLLLDSPVFACAFFGAIKAGAVPVPVNTLWKADDYRYVLEDSAARVLIVSAELWPEVERIPLDALPAVQHVFVAGRDGSSRATGFDALMAEGRPSCAATAVRHDAPAFWLYSSGSTGRPKGCVHLQHDMVVCAELYAKRVLGITADDRCFSVAKLFFAYGLGNALYFPLAVGATSILWPSSPSAAHVIDVAARHRPTLFFSVPTGYAMLLAHDGPVDFSSVRLAVSAGEALPPAVYERFRARFGIDILDGIGSTEALHIFIANGPGAIRPGSSGRLVPGYEARIVDDEDRPVLDGEVGNLWVAGDSTCASYWNQPEKTARTLDGAWLRTGDKYWRDEDGYYWYAGRTDDMLKVGGQWVSPVEVENAVVEHPDVLECAVVAREDADGLTKPAAHVVLRPGTPPTDALAADLQRFVRERIAAHKRPRWVTFHETLPKTATGKLQRFRLRSDA